MTIDQIKHFQESEDKIEFKEAATQYSYKSSRRSVLGYVVALANEGGGYLILGVKEHKSLPHEITGSIAWKGQEGKLEQDIFRDKQIRVTTEVLFEGAKRVLVIKVSSRPIGRVLKFEDVYLIRIEEELLPMSEEQLLVILRHLTEAKTIWEFRFTESQIHNDCREMVYDLLFVGIDKIWTLVNGKNGSIHVQSGAYIFTVPAFNEAVIREAVLNAITHRDYTISSEVVIKQYPKRLIINTPGGFPKAVNKTHLITVSSTPRSRLMAEVLEKTGLVERSGQGV